MNKTRRDVYRRLQEKDYNLPQSSFCAFNGEHNRQEDHRARSVEEGLVYTIDTV